jgi:hypothetical protein
MISLGNGNKLMSLYEVLERLRTHLAMRYAGELSEIRLIADMLDVDEDFLRGALRERREGE